MSDNTLAAELRTEFGKGAARRTRRAHRVPAVLYGHGVDPIHISLPGHQTLLALRQANALLTIEVEGQENRLALPKQVQRDPLRGTIEHVDLIIVRRGEKVNVDIAVTLVGEASPEALVITENTSLAVEAEATHIPDGVEVSIEGLVPGDQIFARDIKLPQGTSLDVDEDLLIVNVTNAPTAEEVEAELAEAEAEAGIEPTIAEGDEGVEAEQGDPDAEGSESGSDAGGEGSDNS